MTVEAAPLQCGVVRLRTFNNGRELGALLGLVPVPSRRDQAVRDHGISKAGRAELRRMWLQIASG
jgi:transposase